MKQLFTTLLFSFFVFGAVNAQIVDSNYRDGVIYVKVNDTSTIDMRTYRSSDVALNLMYAQFGIDTISLPFPDMSTALDHTYRVHFSNHAQINTLMTAMSALGYVEFCEKEPLMHALSSPFTPNDLAPEQYHLTTIFAPDAWGVTQGNPSVIVAVVDNAVRITHSDLAGNLWQNPTPTTGLFDDYPNDLNGWDVADGDNNPNPPGNTTDGSFFGHGTHCAGIAGAVSNNGNGIASIGFNISIMAVKCSPDNSTDSGKTLTNAYDGVYYASMAGAKVISLSWGGDEPGFVTGQNIINGAYAKGIVVVAAAGNENSSTPFYPAAFANVLSVGATGGDDIKSSFSNYGSTVDVMAPGSLIYSLKAGSDNSYGRTSGTSMSAPLVAGLAALIISQNPGWTPDQVMNQIKSTADNIDGLNPGLAGQLGTGRINAARALGATPTTVGIAGIDGSSHMLLVSPNPSNGNFSIQWNGDAPAETISIMDVSGKVLNVQTLELAAGNTYHMNNALAQGIYLVRVTSGGNSYMHRVVVQ